MIKASTTSGIAILALTEENVARLKEGKPMAIDLAEIGLGKQKVVILYGGTVNDIVEDLNILSEGKLRQIIKQQSGSGDSHQPEAGDSRQS